MPFIRFTRYAPDDDPTQPGIIRDGSNLLASENGYIAAPAPRDAPVDTLTASALAAVSVEAQNGTLRTYVGTPTELFQLSDENWLDRSRGGNDYTAGPVWNFAQLGNVTFATNDSSVIQQSTGSTFSDVSGAPVARYIEAVNNQLFAMNTNDGLFGDAADRWRTSALGDTDSWVPAISRNAYSAQLLESPGPITGGRKLGNDIVVYKKHSVYLGRFSGPPLGWVFELVSQEVGTPSHKSIIVVDNSHFFMDESDFYVFNGASVQSIGQGMRHNFFRNELNVDEAEKTTGFWDPNENRILWFYPSLDGLGTLDRYISYDLRSRKWSPPNDLSIQAAVFYIRSTAPTYDGLGDDYATYDDLPALAYDSSFWQTQVSDPAVIGQDRQLKTLDGSASSSTIQIFDFGNNVIRRDISNYSYFTGLRPIFASAPDSGTMVNSYKDNLGDDPVSDSPTITMNGGSFDVEREARWHTARMDFEGDYEILGVDIEIQEEGNERET